MAIRKIYQIPLPLAEHQTPENKYRSVDFSKAPNELIEEAIHHGLTQKLGDLVAKIKGDDLVARAAEVAAAADLMIGQWAQGEWNRDSSRRGPDPLTVQKFTVIFSYLDVPVKDQAKRRKESGLNGLIQSYAIKKAGDSKLKGKALEKATADAMVEIDAKAKRMMEILKA